MPYFGFLSNYFKKGVFSNFQNYILGHSKKNSDIGFSMKVEVTIAVSATPFRAELSSWIVQVRAIRWGPQSISSLLGVF